MPPEQLSTCRRHESRTCGEVATIHHRPSRCENVGHELGRQSSMGVSRLRHRGDRGSTVRGVVPAERRAMGWAAPAALWLTMAGGVALLIAGSRSSLFWLGLAGFVAFVVGTTLAVVVSFTQARSGGVSVVRALAHAARQGLSWLFRFMP